MKLGVITRANVKITIPSSGHSLVTWLMWDRFNNISSGAVGGKFDRSHKFPAKGVSSDSGCNRASGGSAATHSSRLRWLYAGGNWLGRPVSRHNCNSSNHIFS